MIKQRKIELLAPAKNLECGIEAINHGADAVYIGAPKFGARAAAVNSLEDIEALVNSKSLWKCLSCFACVERCPRDVKPGKLIDAARQLVIRQRGETYLSPDEIPELLDPEVPQQLLVSAFRRYRR